MSRSVAWALVAMLLGAAAFMGCGEYTPNDDEAEDGGARPPRRTRGSGGAGTGGASGRAAAGSGGAASRAAAGRGGAPAAAPIACGSSQCASPVPDGFVLACCADSATSTCGVLLGGLCIEPPRGAPGCPALDFGSLFSFPSCCTPRGMCGVDLTSVAVPGCVDLATAADRARMSGASVVFPAPRACDEADAGAAEDAG